MAIAIQTFIQGAKRLEIYSDEDPSNPRDDDNFGTMICFHKRYKIGDNHNFKYSDFVGWESMTKHLHKKYEIVLPLYLMDHSGISISLHPFGCSWDSGQVGFICASKEDIRKNFMIKRVYPHHLIKALELLKGEIQTYDAYIRGDVLGYKVFENEEEIDSCWNFYSLDHILEKTGFKKQEG
jgi:hypothetical protein